MDSTRWLLAGLCLIGLAGCAANNGSAFPDAEQSPAKADGTRTPVSAEKFDYDAYLVILSEASGIANPPPTEIVRVIAPEEQAEVWRSCMNEAGWAVAVTFDGGLGPPPNLPEDQADAYSLDDYLCHAQYPVDQTMFRTFGEEQIEAIYTYYVETLVPCLEQRGYSLDEGPSWDVFRASWVADGQGGFYPDEASWFPYEAINTDAFSPQQWEELNLACPQVPAAGTLYPDE